MRVIDDAGKTLPHDGKTVGNLQVLRRWRGATKGCGAADRPIVGVWEGEPGGLGMREGMHAFAVL